MGKRSSNRTIFRAVADYFGNKPIEEPVNESDHGTVFTAGYAGKPRTKYKRIKSIN